MLACAEFLGRVGRALAGRLNAAHDEQIRYFADVHSERAGNGSGFTLHPNGKSFGASEPLCALPSDALQPCGDGTVAVGIAVLELVPKDPSCTCAGFVFTIERAADGGHCIGAGMESFEEGCSTAFGDRVLKEGAFIKSIR